MRRRSVPAKQHERKKAQRFGIAVVGEIKGDTQSGFSAFVFIGARPVTVQLAGNHTPDVLGPLRLADNVGQSLWAFRGQIFEVSGTSRMPDEEVSLRLKHHVFTSNRELDRMRRELEALENLERLPSVKREKIPPAVRLFVWQRDQGQCISCKSTLNLEFDHIIPLADGGSNTERNVQLLCESCNRSKGRSVA